MAKAIPFLHRHGASKRLEALTDGVFAIVAMYRHIAFRSNMMKKEVSMKARKKVWNRIILGPFLFLFAMAAGYLHVYIPVIIYIMTPIVFLFLPGLDLNEVSDKETA